MLARQVGVEGRPIRKDAAGTVTAYERDLAGRPVRIAGPDADLIYHRDRLGRVKTELVNGRAPSISYDALGRRTRRITPTGVTTTHAYDAAGNQTTAHWPTSHAAAEAAGERAYTGTRLTRAGASRYGGHRVGVTTIRRILCDRDSRYPRRATPPSRARTSRS
ncbi:RHS repeat domain-containing protein [Streptomyces macrosporus]|uniref:Uncharacterized protein n=1 Tax=Streptomyces macrosporus TaxID=44032 RepID=A0ABN3JTR4_9ACTN